MVNKKQMLSLISETLQEIGLHSEDAVSLVIKASMLMNGGEIFILKMQSVRIIIETEDGFSQQFDLFFDAKESPKI